MSGASRRRLPYAARPAGPSAFSRIGMQARAAGRRVGTRVARIGQQVNRAIQQSAIPVAEGALRQVNRAEGVIAGLNRSSGGLLEEGVRRLPFGNDAVLAANTVARGARRGSAALQSIRRVGSTIERGSAAVARQLGAQLR